MRRRCPTSPLTLSQAGRKPTGRAKTPPCDRVDVPGGPRRKQNLQLGQTMQSLNAGLKWLRFSAGGQGTQVSWKLLV